MHMKDYEDLKEMLCEELEEYSRKSDMSAGDLEAIHKLTDTIKNIDKIMMLEEDGEYSMAGDWEAMGRINGNYGYGNSYRNQRRDSMGRYSSARGDRRGGNRGYSRADAKEYMIDQIEDLMEDAESPKVKEALKRAISTIENA